MRTWLVAAVLMGCTGDGVTNTDDTDSGIDTDVETDTEAPTFSIQIVSTEMALEPGGSKTRTFILLNTPVDVGVDASVDPEDCATMRVTGVDEEEPAVQVTASEAFFGRCTLSLEAYGPGEELAEASFPVKVDTDWGGEIYQWSSDDVSRIGDLLSHETQLWVSTSSDGEATPSLGLEQRGADGVLGGTGQVTGETWKGTAGPVAAWQDQRFMAVADADGKAFVVPFDKDGNAGAPWTAPGSIDGFLPTAIHADADGVKVVGETIDEERTRGIVFLSWGLDGAGAESTTTFAPGGSIRPAAAARTADGWMIGGSALGTPFPEVEDGIEWGSFLGRFLTDGTLVSVERVGIENTQIKDLHVLPDGRAVFGGFMRNVDLDGQPSTTGYDAFVRLHKADGSVAWTWSETGDADQRIETLSIVDDVVVAAGQTDKSGYVVGLDLEGGDESWSNTYGSGSTFAQVSATHGLGVVIGGITADNLGAEPSGTFDRFLLRVDAAGDSY